jgi:branched-chain amino acid transport system permease protein
MRKNKLFNTLALLAVSVVVYVILMALMYTGIIDEYNGQLLTLAGIYFIIALSLNLVTGFIGQFALGQAGFMCVGAYTSAIMIINLHMPLLGGVIAGGLVTAIFGFIIGFPTLRLRGDYLAITTLGFGEIIRVIMINLGDLTGGAAGLKGIPSFSDTGDFLLDALIRFSWVFAFAIVSLVVISNLIKSSPGRAIVSIREDEIASNSMGINVSYYKVLAFMVSAFFAGIGGGLYAAYFGYLNPAMFTWLSSVNFVVIIVLGGLGSITGTIIASVAFTYIQEWLRIFKDFRLVIFGLALILIMLFWQKGLMGNKEFSVVGFVRKLLAGEYKPANIVNSFKKFYSTKISKSNKSQGV